MKKRRALRLPSKGLARADLAAGNGRNVVPDRPKRQVVRFEQLVERNTAEMRRKHGFGEMNRCARAFSGIGPSGVYYPIR